MYICVYEDQCMTRASACLELAYLFIAFLVFDMFSFSPIENAPIAYLDGIANMQALDREVYIYICRCTLMCMLMDIYMYLCRDFIP